MTEQFTPETETCFKRTELLLGLSNILRMFKKLLMISLAVFISIRPSLSVLFGSKTATVGRDLQKNFQRNLLPDNDHAHFPRMLVTLVHSITP